MDAGAETVQSPDTRQTTTPNKRFPWKRILWVVVGATLLAVLTLFGYTVKTHWNDPNFVNFLVAWIPFVLSIMLAFIPDSAMKTRWRIIWRTCVNPFDWGFRWTS
jgi:cell division protein FtsW (lipid II flippase)